MKHIFIVMSLLLSFNAYALPPTSDPTIQIACNPYIPISSPFTFYSCEYNFGDGSPLEYSFANQQVTHVYDGPGYYRIQILHYECSTISGCPPFHYGSESDVANITPAEGWQIDPNGPYFGQAGEEVVFLANGSDGYNCCNYRWMFGDGSDASGYLIGHTYEYGDTYNVTVQLTATGNILSNPVLAAANTTATIFGDPDPGPEPEVPDLAWLVPVISLLLL